MLVYYYYYHYCNYYYYYYYYYVCCLLASYLYISSLCSIDKLSSASSFNPHHLLLLLKSSRSCVLSHPTPFTSSTCPSMTSWRRQFLLRIWLIQLTFQHRILFRSFLFFPIRTRTCSLVILSDHFIFSIRVRGRVYISGQVVERTCNYFIDIQGINTQNKDQRWEWKPIWKIRYNPGLQTTFKFIVLITDIKDRRFGMVAAF